MSNNLLSRLYSKLSLFVLVLILAACSYFKKDIDHSAQLASAYLGNIEAKWFDDKPAYLHRDYKGRVIPHLFFDPRTKVDALNRRINFVPITPAESPYLYDFDLRSGQKYKAVKWCTQEDFAKKYGSLLDEIPFTIGIVPRVLDQLSKVQKIIVFGNDQLYQKEVFKNVHNVRVIGGVLEQTCPFAKCTKSTSWLTRLLLVAVDDRDSSFKEVNDINQLKEVVNWDGVQAYLRNYNGHNIWSGAVFPKTRITGQLTPREAIKIILDRSYRFKEERISNLKKSCHRLYELTEKRLLNWEGAIDGYFVDVFFKYFVKMGDRYKTCMEYVKAPSINHNRKIHWFFAHLDAFFILNQKGYYYDCRKNNWYITPTLELAKRKKIFLENLKNCSTESLDRSFEEAKKTFIQLANQKRPFYEYLEYDSGVAGSRDKIHGWVARENRSFVCDENREQRISSRLVKKVFPLDIKWKKKSRQKEDGFIR